MEPLWKDVNIRVEKLEKESKKYLEQLKNVEMKLNTIVENSIGGTEQVRKQCKEQII